VTTADRFIKAAALHYAELEGRYDRNHDAFTMALELAAKDEGFWSAAQAVKRIGAELVTVGRVPVAEEETR
jgi:hypothetical protein